MLIKINVTPFEFVFSGFSLQVEAEEALDGQSAQSAIRLQDQRATIMLSGRGRKAIVHTAQALLPGKHTLVIENLYSTSGKRLEESLTVLFFLVDCRGTVPKNFRVYSFNRVVVKGINVLRVSPFERPRGTFYDLLKAVDTRTDTPRELAFDGDGRVIDFEHVQRNAIESYVRRYGVMHPQLYTCIAAASPRARLNVAIWRKHPNSHPGVSEKAADVEATNESPDSARRISEIAAGNRRFIARPELGALSRILVADKRAPVLFGKLLPSEIMRVARDPEVAGVFLVDTSAVPDLDDSVDISRADSAHSSNVEGKGIRAAVWEEGPDNTSQLSIAASYRSLPNSSSHARLTHGIIKNTQATGSTGYAPLCSLHSANSYDLGALKWGCDQGCTVISQSFHRNTEPSSDDLVFDDIYKDWLALHWPYPTIVQAAGNYWNGDSDNINPPESEYVNHKGFNTIAVGNHDDTAGAMSASSVFRNPASRHGDRELPEICANGTGITAVGLTNSGTSFAAPAVAGCAALIQSVDGVLKSWPEGCRAILLAGAMKNVKDSTWWTDVAQKLDASDGSGAVDAMESVSIAKARKTRNNQASQRGWDVGTLKTADFNSLTRLSTFSYNIIIPQGFPRKRKVKVALAWDSKVSEFSIFGLHFPLSSKLTVDFDLMVYDSQGAIVSYSGSWDNSYEIAEFQATAGETYTIRIRRWSGTDEVWYGISWSVPGLILLPRGVTLDRLETRPIR